MNPKELIEIALRVLTAWTGGSKPIPADLNALKEAFSSSTHLPADDLACQVIRDLNGLALGTAQADTASPDMDQVA
jgi:hypothetical protein